MICSKLYLSAILFSAASFVLFAGGGREPESAETGTTVANQSGFPLTVNDDTGHTLTLPAQPQRIASLTLFTDDVLLELVDLERIIAVTHLSEDEAISNIAERVIPIPNKVTMNVEILVSLQPDIVFVADWSEAAKVQQLRDAGLAVYSQKSGVDMAQIQEQIAVVARLVGEPENGQKLIDRMDRRLSTVQDKVKSIPADRRLSIMDYTVWGVSMGQGSTWNVIVTLAGLHNIVGDLEADNWGQVPVSKETLLEFDPDILILPGWVYGDPQGAEAFLDQIRSDPALRTLRAIQQNRVYQIPENLRSSTSHYIVEAVEYLAELAYPELF